MSDMVTLLDGAEWGDGDRFWDGEASHETPEGQLITAALPPSLQDIRLGDHGPAVAAWQKRLQELGFSPGNVDGHFGLRTDTATRALQRVHGLTVDGIVGTRTRDAAASVPAPLPVPTAFEVPRVRTPLSESDLTVTLHDGHVSAFGTEPSLERLGCAWAQMALEHAHGFAVWCNNIGNVTAFHWAGPYYEFSVRERVKRDPDVWKTLALHFRAHDSALLGASDYWHLIASRYAPALLKFDAGDPAAAAFELSKLGYYTALAGPYAAAMATLYHDFQRRF
jgi:hypothetical protein